MTELTKLIDKIVTDKTFSLDALKAIEGLRSRAEALEETVSDLKSEGEQQREKIHTLTKEKEKLLIERKTVLAREESISERESKVNELSKTAAVAKAESAVFEKCFGLVFRNTAVRKEIFGNEPFLDGSGYVNQMSTSKTIEETES